MLLGTGSGSFTPSFAPFESFISISSSSLHFTIVILGFAALGASSARLPLSINFSCSFGGVPLFDSTEAMSRCFYLLVLQRVNMKR